jgi:hypothetical protein
MEVALHFSTFYTLNRAAHVLGVTTPKVSTVKRGGSRFYVHPTSRGKVPGVTSVVDMLPKPFLKWWAAKLVAETAVDNVGSIVTLAMNDRAGAIDYLKRAPDRFTKGAADVGSEAHDLFERLAKGEKIGRLHPDFEPYARHFRDFLDKWQPEYLAMEETVWSHAHGYAGSFDAMAIVQGEPVVVDYKTTRSGVHSSVALQLAAYRYADVILGQDGTERPLPALQGGAVLHVRPEGWGLYPVKCDEEIHSIFLHLLEVFRWDKEIEHGVVGTPLPDPSPAPEPEAPKARTRASKAS